LILVILAWSPFSAGGDWLTVLIVLILVVIGIEAIRRTSLAEDSTLVEDELDEVDVLEVEADLVAATTADSGREVSSAADSE